MAVICYLIYRDGKRKNKKLTSDPEIVEITPQQSEVVEETMIEV